MRRIEDEQVFLRIILSESRTHDRKPLFRKIIEVLRAGLMRPSPSVTRALIAA